MTFLSGVTLEKNDKSTAQAEDVLKGKVIALYFSAHWCPPCRAFTPILKDFYEEADGEVEIVFVSFDRSEKDLKSYMSEAHGDWYHIPFGNDKIKALAAQFEVSGIPQLVVVTESGKVVTKDGKTDVSQSKAPKQVVAAWAKKSAEVASE